MIKSTVTMNQKETLKFIKLWNGYNGFSTDNNTVEENMRYFKNGEVTWNSYNAPIVNIIEIVGIYNQIKGISNYEIK